MNSAPHLLNQDRPEYEQILDDALRDAPHRPELAAVGGRLSAEQLRTMAMHATALIASAAATEYEHYVRVREELRSSGAPYASVRSSRPSTGPASAAGSRSGTGLATTGQPAPTGRGRRFRAAVLGSAGAGGSRGSDGVAPQRWSAMSYGRRLLAALLGLRVRPEPLRVRPQPLTGAPTPHTPEQSAGVRPPARPRPGTGASLSAEAAEPQGAGAFAVFAVLAPVLSGTAAVIFFLVGLVLKMFRAESAVAGTMISAGWLFAAAAVGAIVVCVTILLVTAVRRRDRQTEEDPGYGEIEEVERARDAWREALLERGIVPFLREALDPARAPAGGPSAPSGRLPALGYHRPDFSAPGDRPDPDSSPRPRYTSPDFTSPDFGGPEHRPD